MSEFPVLATRGATGLNVYKLLEEPKSIFEHTTEKLNKAVDIGKVQCQVRCHQFSPDGRFMAFCDGQKTMVICTKIWQEYMVLDGVQAKTTGLHFSPKSTFLCTFQTLFGNKNQQGSNPNLFLYDLKTQQLLLSFVDANRQKWQFHWTDDESICSRLVGSELLFHENNKFDKYSHKLVLPKMADFSISSSSKALHVAAYVPVGKDTPAVVKVYRYPDFSTVIAAKTFFKADRVSMQWNKKGTALIIMAIVDVDSTGQSYYGEQNLYFVSTNGDSYMVPLAKNGPVYCVEWSPLSNQYCVVYGYMPAKATLYNLKGDVIFDFGTGPRNEAHYDPFGKVLCICGFGNLRGNIEFWDVGNVSNRKRINHQMVEDTTVFRWCPDGQHFITATTAPRLRVNNCWKIWKYNGELIAKFNLQGNLELWDVSWKPDPDAAELPMLNQPSQNNQTANPAGNKSVGAYVPPHLRNVANKPAFKLHELELSTDQKLAQQNQCAKSKKKNKASSTGFECNGNTSAVTHAPPTDTLDPEKRIRNLNKKLEQIAALKERQARGENLELNQQEKIKKEQELIDEINLLRL